MPPISHPNLLMTAPASAPPHHSAAYVLLVALLALAAGCAPKEKPRAPRVPVAVAAAVERPMPFAIMASGTIEPVQTAAVGSQVGGTVTAVLFREGSDVRAGQALIQLDPRPFRDALAQAQGALARDRAQAENARLDAERADKLFAENLLARAEYDQKRSAAASLAATVKADEAAASTARLNLHYATIHAPIAGRTGNLNVHVGDLVKAATSDPLVTINQVHPVRVRFAVPESAVPLVQRHRAAHPRVIVLPSEDDSLGLAGTLVFVDNAVDAATGTLLLKGELPNVDGRLVPGEFVQVRLELYVQPHATVVPAPAVTNGQQGTYVYVLNADSTVTMRPVQVERTADELAIVTRGLKAGEVVIIDGQFRLAPGAKVMVRREGPGRS
jgi:membrane fusion protein, multidrug efflux system